MSGARMNLRTARKINRRTAECVVTGQPVPYTRPQVRRALHRLRRTWRGARREAIWAYSVSYAAGPDRWCVGPTATPLGLRAFPWESEQHRLRAMDLSPAIEACERLGRSLHDLGETAATAAANIALAGL